MSDCQGCLSVPVFSLFCLPVPILMTICLPTTTPVCQIIFAGFVSLPTVSRRPESTFGTRSVLSVILSLLIDARN